MAVSDTLLRTKLFIPQVRPSLVPRPRLFAKLDHGLQAKLTLVAAPAGYGKTTLVADWLGRSPAAGDYAFCWLSLDESENDPVRFLAYIAAALDTIEPDVVVSVSEYLGAGQNPAHETLSTLLINDAASISKPFVLVLDDYHTITSAAVQEVMSFLIEHLPPLMHLILISRADPPLPLARLRGQGQLVDLRQGDLRFSAQEAATFLRQVMRLDLSAEDIRLLNDRAEGWIAGLQMAAVSIQEREDSGAFIRAFTGSNRYILDYLLEEVLQRQPPPVQRFLLQTAVLNRFTGPLCHYLLRDEGAGQTEGQPLDAAMILAALDAANLFIIPLDDQRRWYRYHRLFADLLRQRLRQTHPERLPLLHRRACHWFREQGYLSEAFDHALAGEDTGAAIELAEQMAEDMLRRSEIASLVDRVGKLPAEKVRQRPQLALYFAWAHLLNGSPLEMITSCLPPASKDLRLASIARLIHAFLAIFQGDLAQARASAHQAMADLPEDDLFWRSQAAWILSAIYPAMLERPAAGEWATLEEAAQIGLQAGNLMVAVSAMCEQAHNLRRQGRLHEAEARYEQALALAVDARGRAYPIAGEALMGLGQLALEWNRLQEAERQLLAGIDKTLLWREIAAFTGYLLLAQLRQAQGDAASADAALEDARQLALRFDATEHDDLIVAAYRARLWVMQGRLEQAARWVEERGLLEGRPPVEPGADYVEVLRCYEEMVLARLWLLEGKHQAAIDLVQRNMPRFNSWGRVRLIIEAHLLRAQALLALNDRVGALGAVQQALNLAEPGRFIRVFLDEGQPVLHLLAQVQPESQEQAAYIAELLAAAGHTAAAADQVVPQPLIEPLSERELEVLGLIAVGLSNREIAQRLVLSLPTVKWHCSNIYGKLGAKNRTTAVAKARELGLLHAQ